MKKYRWNGGLYTKQEYERYKAVHRASRLKRKRKLIDLLGGKCIDCGYSNHLAALDFDHVDPKRKKFGMGFALSESDIKFSELVVEARKCVIRCANCHRIKTNPQATD